MTTNTQQSRKRSGLKRRTAPTKRKTRPHQIEIRNPDDELVTHSPVNVHIERMSDDRWWMRFCIGDETVVAET